MRSSRLATETASAEGRVRVEKATVSVWTYGADVLDGGLLTQERGRSCCRVGLATGRGREKLGSKLLRERGQRLVTEV